MGRIHIRQAIREGLLDLYFISLFTLWWTFLTWTHNDLLMSYHCDWDSRGWQKHHGKCSFATQRNCKKERVGMLAKAVLFDWRRSGSRSPAQNEDALSNPLTAQEGNSFGAPEKVIDWIKGQRTKPQWHWADWVSWQPLNLTHSHFTRWTETIVYRRDQLSFHLVFIVG